MKRPFLDETNGRVYSVRMDHGIGNAGGLRIHPLLDKDAPVRPSVYSRPPWHLVECVETGFVYLANPPQYAQLDEEFSWEKTKAEENAKRVQEEPVVAWISKWSKFIRRSFRRERRIQREAMQLLIATGNPSPTVLDLGCGSGRTLLGLTVYAKKECGIKVIPIGIEISRKLAAKAHANLVGYNGEVIHAPAVEGLGGLAGLSVDLILLSSYLEHETQPLEALKLCHRTLASGAAIIIKVPNFASINRRVRRQRWCGFRFPDHVNYFTPRSLRMLVDKAGFEVARMNFFDRLPTSDNMWLIARKRS
jgi:SAM-dependent methyltransferase